jgi:predicted ATP-binding protein involved in virulence
MTESSSDTNKKSTPVYFASIEVENVLCFKTPQKLDLCDANGFPAQWTVILGDNGVGKTTLLRCLASMQPTIKFFLDSGEEVIPKIRFGVGIWPELFASGFLGGLSLTAQFIYGLSLINKKKLLSRNQEGLEVKNAIMKFQVVNQKVVSFKGSNDLDLLNIQCNDYGANRKMGTMSLTEKMLAENTSTLFSDEEKLINAEDWLLQADYAVARSVLNKNKFKKQFDLVSETLKNLLPDVTDVRIALADDSRSRPMAEFLTPYGWVPFSSLGLGYRTVVAWMVDLSARMIDRYPDSENPLAEPAVVLVDEIDLHLHPKWQRTIMSFLTERFPNVQFIVTAHSPLVVQAARNANLVLLRREGDHVVIDNNPEVIENWRVEQVLTSVFELPSTLPADIEPLIQRRREILTKSSLTKKDKQELKELEAKIGNLPAAESAADIQAMDIIRKAAKLLENR